jgi:hypothetical protein
MLPVIQTKTIAAAVTTAVCASQTPGGAGALLLNGTLANAGGTLVTFLTPQLIGVISAGNIAARTFTVVGVDGSGNLIGEVITGVNNNTVNSTLSYKYINSITIDAGSGSALTVGTVAVGSTNPVLLEQHVAPFNVSLSVVVVGTVNYTVQYTFGNVYPVPPTNLSSLTWTDHPVLAALTATADSNLAFPVSAVRLTINSGAGSVTFTVRQAGLFG